MTVLKRGARGSEVKKLQRLLTARGYPVADDGDFGRLTANAVMAFQSQHLDQHGEPLKPDGEVGPLTWWSLTHPDHPGPLVIDYTRMPANEAGGSKLGRLALAAAVGEVRAGAAEVGGNNRGPWVRKYLAPARLPEGNPWCASFVSWCYLRACGDRPEAMPFRYQSGARSLFKEMQAKGWAYPPGSGYQPQPGDVVIWWRIQLAGWQGHAGLVYESRDGMLYTIEGNKSSRVQGFRYVLSRMDKLLGFGHVPDA